MRRDSAGSLHAAIMGLYHEVHSWNEAAAVQNWAELVDLSAQRLWHEPRHDERLLRLWRAVDADLAQPWTLPTLATHVHLSAEQLRHLCQKNFGRSPMEHLRWLRMKRAAGLLVRTNQKIAVVAAEVGYENPFAFTTAFKRVLGVAPRDIYRRQTLPVR